MFHAKQTTVIFRIVPAVLVFGYLVFVVSVLLSVQVKPLVELSFKRAASYLIAVPSVKRDGVNGVMTLRVRDGKEQFVPGKWDIFYASNSSVYLYGISSGFTGSSTTGPHLYNFLEGSKIFDIPLNSVSGSVIGIQENRPSTYLLIKSIVDEGAHTRYCLMEHLASKAPPCPVIGLSDIDQAVWSTENEHELVFLTKSGDVYTVDPWENQEGAPLAVSAEKDGDRFVKLKNLFQSLTLDPIHTSGNDSTSLMQIVNLAFVKDLKGKMSVYCLPLGSSIAWYFDQQHFLVKEKNRISIYDLLTRTLHPLLEEKGIGEGVVLFYDRVQQVL